MFCAGDVMEGRKMVVWKGGGAGGRTGCGARSAKLWGEISGLETGGWVGVGSALRGRGEHRGCDSRVGRDTSASV